MSLVPLILWENLIDQPRQVIDQDLGLALRLQQLMNREREYRNPLQYYRPWAELLNKGDVGFSTVKADKDKFQVILDVQHFKPDEINVKVVDKCVVVEAKHEEKRDEHGWISREFVRKYLIPEQCDIDQVTSELSTDGVLSITAPRKDQPSLENEKRIKIEQTGKPAIRERVSESKEKKEAKEKEEESEKEETEKK